MLRRAGRKRLPLRSTGLSQKECRGLRAPDSHPDRAPPEFKFAFKSSTSPLFASRNGAISIVASGHQTQSASSTRTNENSTGERCPVTRAGSGPEHTVAQSKPRRNVGYSAAEDCGRAGSAWNCRNQSAGPAGFRSIRQPRRLHRERGRIAAARWFSTTLGAASASLSSTQKVRVLRQRDDPDSAWSTSVCQHWIVGELDSPEYGVLSHSL